MQERFVYIGNGYYAKAFAPANITVNILGEMKKGNKKIDSYQGISANLLLSILSKSVLWPVELWPELDLHYLDGDCQNPYPVNTVWKLPKGGLEHPWFSGKFIIPGFSRYVIDRDGNVYSVRGYVLRPLVKQRNCRSDYLFFNLSPDIGRPTMVGRYRVMALAFIQYPPYVDELDVNHIDGIGSNDKVENLEWSSRQDNVRHAFQIGLRTDNKIVLVRDITTGEETEYYSISECARQFGLVTEAIVYRLKSDGQRVFLPHHLFKFKKSKTDWASPTVEEVEKTLTTNGTVRWFKLNTPNGKEHVVRGNLGAALVIGISVSLLSRLISKNGRNGIIRNVRYEILSPLSPAIPVDGLRSKGNKWDID